MRPNREEVFEHLVFSMTSSVSVLFDSGPLECHSDATESAVQLRVRQIRIRHDILPRQDGLMEPRRNGPDSVEYFLLGQASIR